MSAVNVDGSGEGLRRLWGHKTSVSPLELVEALSSETMMGFVSVSPGWSEGASSITMAENRKKEYG